ncbi:MAG: rod-binding protein [Gemmatimonadales bacterium]
MTAPLPGLSAAAGTDPRTARADKLQGTARQLEGVFVLQMLKAMRATVPKGGITEASSGEETFTSMLDQKMADKIPQQWKHGLTDALMKQLVARDATSSTASASTIHTTPAPEPSK